MKDGESASGDPTIPCLITNRSQSVSGISETQYIAVAISAASSIQGDDEGKDDATAQRKRAIATTTDQTQGTRGKESTRGRTGSDSEPRKGGEEKSYRKRKRWQNRTK